MGEAGLRNKSISRKPQQHESKRKGKAVERVGQGQAVWWVVTMHLQGRHQAQGAWNALILKSSPDTHPGILFLLSRLTSNSSLASQPSEYWDYKNINVTG